MTDTGQGSNPSPTIAMKRAFQEMNRSSKKVTRLQAKYYKKSMKNLAKFIQYKEISDTILSFHTKNFNKDSYQASEYTAMLHENLTSWVEGIIENHELAGKSHRYLINHGEAAKGFQMT